jgi:hypothetical protein
MARTVGTTTDFSFGSESAKEIKRPPTISPSTSPSTDAGALRSPTAKTTTSATEQSAANDASASISFELAPPDRMYPHVFDSAGHEGKARIFLLQAIQDCQRALESYGEGVFGDVPSRLALIATAMSQAQEFTRFNENLGAIVSHIRRAALVTDPTTVDRPALNALGNVLSAAADNPMLDLDDASDRIEELAKEGWSVEMPQLETFLGALFDEDATEDIEAIQRALFADDPTPLS